MVLLPLPKYGMKGSTKKLTYKILGSVFHTCATIYHGPGHTHA